MDQKLCRHGDVFIVHSELLQALDLCDNDPVAVARCFVMKVRGEI